MTEIYKDEQKIRSEKFKK